MQLGQWQQQPGHLLVTQPPRDHADVWRERLRQVVEPRLAHLKCDDVRVNITQVQRCPLQRADASRFGLQIMWDMFGPGWARAGVGELDQLFSMVGARGQKCRGHELQRISIPAHCSPAQVQATVHDELQVEGMGLDGHLPNRWIERTGGELFE